MTPSGSTLIAWPTIAATKYDGITSLCHPEPFDIAQDRLREGSALMESRGQILRRFTPQDDSDLRCSSSRCHMRKALHATQVRKADR